MFCDETKYTHYLCLANTVGTILFGVRKREGEGVEWRRKGEKMCVERGKDRRD